MAMQRWRPRAMMPSRMMEEMERMMEESFGEWPWRVIWRRAPEEEMAWSPSIDMYEKEDAFIIRADIPGVSKDDIDISMTGDTLTIRGERKLPADIKREEYECSEICYGTFSRSITLPAAVDAEKIEATYENGILEIRLTKVREAMPQKVQIKAK